MADEINQKVVFDIRDALKALEEVAKEGNKTSKKIADDFGAVKFSSFLNIGKEILNFGRQVADIFQIPIQEASKFEETVNGLRVALNLSGISSEQAVQKFVDFGQQIQNTTKYSDDAAIATASLIESLSNLPTDELQRATKAALDLSTSLRIDLDSAARLVGKAAEGNVASFKKFGIEVKKGKTDAETFANALDALEKKFGGSSEQSVNTYAGATAQLTNAVDDLIKQFGLLIIQNPEVIGFIKDLTKSIQDLDGTGAKAFKIVTDLGKAISFLADIAQIPFESPFDPSIADIPKAFADARAKELDVTDELIKASKTYRGELAAQDAQAKANKAFADQLKKEEAEAKKQAEARKKDEDRQLQDILNRAEANRKLFNSLKEDTAELSAASSAAAAKTLEEIEKEKQARLALQEVQRKERANQIIAGTIGGAISGIQQGGKAGVASTAAGLLSNLGPYGAAAGAALQFLSQDKEQIRAQLQGFIDGIPQIIDAIAEAIPVVVEVLANNAGKITTALSLQMPFVANKLAVELAIQSPYIAKAFAQSMINEAGRIAQAIADAVKGVFSNLGGSLGGGGTGALLGGLLLGGGGALTGGLIGGFFADGGIVEGGPPYTDRIPIMATPGEGVLNRQEVADLRGMKASIDQLAQYSGAPQVHNVEIKMGLETFAKLQLETSRRGLRVTSL